MIMAPYIPFGIGAMAVLTMSMAIAARFQQLGLQYHLNSHSHNSLSLFSSQICYIAYIQWVRTH